jgi:isoleucyl-tRNA synthetase
MHKSLGNAVSPKEVIDSYGADILRLWVSSVEFTVDARISPDILKQLSEVYRKIRNTARILLGNLGTAETDFNPVTDTVEEDKLPDIDKWALARLNGLVKECNEAYKACRFHDVYHAVSNFCTIEMSKMYIDIAKDRTYASAKDGFGRRCAQTTMYKILSALTRLISPILSFTADEIWKTMAHVEGEDVRNVLLNDMPMYDASEPFAKEEARYEKLFALRDTVLFALEGARASKLIGKSLEAKVVITANKSTYDFLNSFDKDELSDVFIVSGTALVEGAVADGQEISVEVAKADGNKCARCWKHSVDAVEVDGEYICPRCGKILGI